MGRRKNVIDADLFEREVNIPKQLETDYDACLNDFIKRCKIRNLSEDTVKYYWQKLTLFRDLLEQQRISTDPTKMSLEIIQNNIILYLMDNGNYKASSINALLRAVRAFYNYLYENGMIEHNPVRKLALVKAQKKVIETFSRDQLLRLFDQPNTATFTGFRDLTMLQLFVETGIRLREMSDLMVRDIRWEDAQILVKGKGAKDRLVPFQPKMRRQLRKYVTIRGDIACDHLFVNIDNHPLSRRQIQDRVRKYGRMANIKNVRCSPHTLRHTFAKLSVQNGADVFALQAVLGHESLDMVRNYVNLFSNEVADAHRKFSPLESLIKR